jgi:5'-3' exoribonuclease 2
VTDVGVALLPFIDETRLLKAMEPLYGELTDEENFRNAMGNDLLFVAQQNALYDFFAGTFYAMDQSVEVHPPQFEVNQRVHLNPRTSKRLIAAVGKDENCVPHGSYSFPLPLANPLYPPISTDTSLRYL